MSHLKSKSIQRYLALSVIVVLTAQASIQAQTQKSLAATYIPKLETILNENIAAFW